MKRIITTKTPFAIVKKSVNDLVNFVKPTFGPSENKVLIHDEFQPIVLDDGVRIAEKFSSNDRIENTIINLIKAVSKKTNKRVGDGTTGSMILLQSIINELPDIFDSSSIVKELKAGLEEAVKQLKSKSKPVTTKKQLLEVALVSCNNKEIAEIISEVINNVGPDGSVSVEEGSENKTTYEITDGFQFDQGYVSHYMANIPEKMESCLKNARVLIADKTLEISDVMPLMEKLVKLPIQEKRILIIANDFSQDLTTLLVVNGMKGVFDIVAVKSPGFGKEKLELLRDIASVCNTRICDDQNKVEDITYEQLGHAEKIVVNQNETIIFKGGGNTSDRIKYLKGIKPSSDFDAKKITDRIAKLSNGIAVIKAGGFTEEEMRSVKEKIDDAVNATKVAYKHGIVPGAGIALSKIKTLSETLNKALKAPKNILKENIGIESNIKEDIHDPTEVLVAGLESAVSIACLLIATKGILVTYEEEKHDKF